MDSTKLERIQKITVTPDNSLLEALKKMDETNTKLLLVMQKNKVVGVVSIGDVQRSILKNIPLTDAVRKVLRKGFLFASEEDSEQLIKEQILERRTEFMPVLSENKTLVNIYFWNELFAHNFPKRNKMKNIPVVIMAGGKGTRLHPITKILPKPLVPVGEKTILEHIFDNFLEVGCNQFLMTINYKAEMLKLYFSKLSEKKYEIDYYQEKEFLGTAGSLYFLRNKLKSTFFVSNCDIIIDADYSEFYDYHKQNKNDITVVGVLKHFQIPYGVLETGDNGVMTSINEKPEYTFKINSGMYILEPHVLKMIPPNKFYHITDLIEDVNKNGGKVGVFPVTEGSWMDIGEWREYNKTAKKMGVSEINFA